MADIEIVPVEPKQKCAFLRLPNEIRNATYELVLVVKRFKIAVRKGCRLPPLLETCRQIRDEASGIFCSQNEFRLDILDAPNDTLPQKNHWLWQRNGIEGCNLAVHGYISWLTVKEWLRLEYEGVIRITYFSAPSNRIQLAMNAALDNVRKYRVYQSRGRRPRYKLRNAGETRSVINDNLPQETDISWST